MEESQCSLQDITHHILSSLFLRTPSPRFARFLRNAELRTAVDIVGPVCESGDYFAKDRELSEVKSGDLLAILDAGAYGFSMSSNYNARPKVVEILVEKDKFHVIRKREDYEDLIRAEEVRNV